MDPIKEQAKPINLSKLVQKEQIRKITRAAKYEKYLELDGENKNFMALKILRSKSYCTPTISNARVI